MFENLNWGVVLGTVAGAMQIAGYLLYLQQMLKGSSKPNAVSWTLWFFMIILNAASYFQMSGDWVKTILPAVSSLMIVVIYSVLVFKIGVRLSKLSAIEWTVLIIGTLACLAWWMFKSAAFGNLIFQFAFALSFAPTIKGVWNHPGVEKPGAWIVFSAAYFFSLLVVAARWQNHLQDLVFPLNAFFLHCMVAVLSLRKIFANHSVRFQ